MQSLKVSQLLLLSGMALIGKVGAQTVERTVIASDGGHFSGTAQTVSWTIGEPCSETHIGGGRAITQGFQQPQIKLSSIATYEKNEGSLFVYPNPVGETLNLSFEDLSPGSYVSELYDLRGALIKNFQLQVAEGMQTFQLEMGNLPNAEYVLRVRSKDNRFVQSIKIFTLNPF